MRFDDYYAQLLGREGFPPQSLIRAWTGVEIGQIHTLIRNACVASGIIGSIVPNFIGTNQSKGNKAADHFRTTVGKSVAAPDAMKKAKGAGYPDLLIQLGASGFCMEMKSTSKFKSKDSNRRVLTSSSEKLRALIKNGEVTTPPAHLVCLVHYDENSGTIQKVDLNFLQPDSLVNIRLEASTSFKLLTDGAHPKFSIS